MHFLDEFARKNRRDIKGFSPNAMDTLIRYKWPGNVRELMNAVERGVVMARNDYLRRPDLSFILDDAPEQIREVDLNLENITLSKVEERAILSTLAAAGGNKSEAARRLGITRKTLFKKLKQYGNEPKGN